MIGALALPSCDRGGEGSSGNFSASSSMIWLLASLSPARTDHRSRQTPRPFGATNRFCRLLPNRRRFGRPPVLPPIRSGQGGEINDVGADAPAFPRLNRSQSLAADQTRAIRLPAGPDGAHALPSGKLDCLRQPAFRRLRRISRRPLQAAAAAGKWRRPELSFAGRRQPDDLRRQQYRQFFARGLRSHASLGRTPAIMRT